LNLVAQNDYYVQEINERIANEKVYPFGVASGDPTNNSVILWTKINPNKLTENKLTCEVSTDSSFIEIISTNLISLGQDNAFTAKIKIENLEAGKYYYYRFTYNDKRSPIGRTKTLSLNPTSVKIAVVSCSNYQVGEFNAYGHMAKRTDIDFVVHLGDYIYEGLLYKPNSKRTQKEKIREHIPNGTCHKLIDYRSRYAQYKLDEQLQECHRLHPFINIWDDHEFSNNINSEIIDLENERFNNGKMAFFEWIPIDDSLYDHIYRSFNFGNLLDLWMLDGRTAGRSSQVQTPQDVNWSSTERSMLGSRQRDWLTSGMKSSKAKWQIIGNQVMFSSLKNKVTDKKAPGAFMDAWEGYPYERSEIFKFWRKNKINNIAILTGDIHTSWAIELTEEPRNKEIYNPKKAKFGIGAELITPSVTYFNLDEVMPTIVAKIIKTVFNRKKTNPHLKFLDVTNHGYMSLKVTEDKISSTWHFLKTIKSRNLKMKKEVKYTLKPDQNILEKE
jgi:alkaline phosphatase D